MLGALLAQPVTFGGCVTPDANWVNAANELGLASQQPTLEDARPGDHVRSGDWLAGRVDMFNSPDFLCIGPIPAKESFVAQLSQAGVRPGSMDEFHALRIEAGFPWHGVDISEDHIAQEAGRTDRTISFNKGCYLGQEPIARLDAMGHTNRELRGILIAGDTVPQPGAAVVRDGVEVGKITSAAWSPRRQAVVALAMLRVAAGAPGTTLQVPADGQHSAGTVFWPRLS
jgi:folate-binding protein YgfZ